MPRARFELARDRSQRCLRPPRLPVPPPRRVRSRERPHRNRAEELGLGRRGSAWLPLRTTRIQHPEHPLRVGTAPLCLVERLCRPRQRRCPPGGQRSRHRRRRGNTGTTRRSRSRPGVAPLPDDHGAGTGHHAPRTPTGRRHQERPPATCAGPYARHAGTWHAVAGHRTRVRWPVPTRRASGSHRRPEPVPGHRPVRTGRPGRRTSSAARRRTRGRCRRTGRPGSRTDRWPTTRRRSRC